MKDMLVQKGIGLEVFLTKYMLIIKRMNTKGVLAKKPFVFFFVSFFNFLSFSVTAPFRLTC